MKNQFDKNSFSGVISALPTPFFKGEVDFDSLEKMVSLQISNGINGFVVNGTTAESPTLTENEVQKIFERVQKTAHGKIPLILGTGSNSTEITTAQTKKAAQLGADAALVVVPYYNKPPQRGLEQHFLKVADSAAIPIILYNVPGRTITGMTAETVVALSAHQNIMGIKEASGDIAFDEKLKAQLPKDFMFLSGDDPTYLPFLKLGGNGIISVMSNLITAACARWTQMMKQKNDDQAESDFNRYKELIQLMYVEANPIPLKWMLHRAGIFRSAEARLPLVALDEKFYGPIEKQMKILELV